MTILSNDKQKYLTKAINGEGFFFDEQRNHNWRFYSKTELVRNPRSESEVEFLRGDLK